MRVISQQPLHEMTGRFVMQLPWKSLHEGLGRSYDQALYGFQHLEKQLYYQPYMQKNYTYFTKNMKNLDICTWYLGIMEMTARKYFTCLITWYSNMVAAQQNSG
jgi:hypothetical protein